MNSTFLPAVRVLGLLTLATGILYPLAITGIAKGIAPQQANGSELRDANGSAIGSALLAQKFTEKKYFWPRPSAGDYATVASGASNLGPTSASLKSAIAERADALRAAHGLAADAPIPDELVTTSGSGLDPHLSPEAARFQIERVAKARGFDAAQLAALKQAVEANIEAPQFHLFGDARVNVLRLNLALDRIGSPVT